MVRLLVRAPLIRLPSARSVPFQRHWKEKGGVPVTVALKNTFVPSGTVRLCGCVRSPGDTPSTVKLAARLVTLPAQLLRTTVYCPASAHWTFATVSTRLVAPDTLPPSVSGTPSLRHW